MANVSRQAPACLLLAAPNEPPRLKGGGQGNPYVGSASKSPGWLPAFAP
jgi:hypothetical protein